jgi:hypothetical protein
MLRQKTPHSLTVCLLTLCARFFLLAVLVVYCQCCGIHGVHADIYHLCSELLGPEELTRRHTSCQVL